MTYLFSCFNELSGLILKFSFAYFKKKTLKTKICLNATSQKKHQIVIMYGI